MKQQPPLMVSILALSLLSGTTRSYAPTPQEAAVRTVYSSNNAHVVVDHANVLGRYATASVHGGLMEGSPVPEPIFLERFSFGWQALDVLESRCPLLQRAIERHNQDLLMRGMLKPKHNGPCNDMKDLGPHADIEAVRRQMRGPLVPSVVVWGRYAMGSWYGAGGGESLYRKQGAHWHLIAGGGGAMGVAIMRRYGVPQAAWCLFAIYDANCKRKR